jgi:hypothetical protein
MVNASKSFSPEILHPGALSNCQQFVEIGKWLSMPDTRSSDYFPLETPPQAGADYNPPG